MGFFPAKAKHIFPSICNIFCSSGLFQLDGVLDFLSSDLTVLDLSP